MKINYNLLETKYIDRHETNIPVYACNSLNKQNAHALVVMYVLLTKQIFRQKNLIKYLEIIAIL